jgi:hypothetical protein
MNSEEFYSVFCLLTSFFFHSFSCLLTPSFVVNLFEDEGEEFLWQR